MKPFCWPVFKALVSISTATTDRKKYTGKFNGAVLTAKNRRTEAAGVVDAAL
jgi:hypothetical protein